MNRQHLLEILSVLQEISSEANNLYSDEIEWLYDLFQENKYKVAVMGEFSTGKSTFLNALVGKRILFSSMREATGVVTCLQKGKTAEAVIVFDEGRNQTISLEQEQGCKELEKYVDIKSSVARVSRITVFYPFDGFDEDIAFIDTPGLQGMSTKQAEMTKDIVKECNAIIMLIKPKGLTATELAILQGKDRIFGKINTRDVFLVVNQIGTVYEGKSQEEAEATLNKIEQTVAKELQANDINGVKVFLVDSRDFLWSIDKTEYERQKAGTNFSVQTMLSPEEYRKRSRFERFKDYLMEFLEESQRNKNFIADMQSKVQLLTEALKEYFEAERQAKDTQNDQAEEYLEKQAEIILDNRRRLYNLLARYLSESFDAFEKNVKVDLEAAKLNQTKYLAKIIDQRIVDQDDLKQVVARDCYQIIRGEVLQDAVVTENKLNQYQKTLTTYLLQKRFNEDLARTLQTNEKISLSFKLDELKITLKTQFVENSFEEEEVVKNEEEELKGLQEVLQNRKNKLEEMRRQTSAQVLAELRRRQQTEKEKKDKALRNLGIKPEPQAVYRTRTRTKGFLFFKKKYEEEVFDHWDDSPVLDWERKRQAILQTYYKIRDQIDEKIDEFNEGERTKLHLEQQIAELIEEIIKQKLVIKDMKHQLQIRKQQKRQRYIKERKNEIFKTLKVQLQREYEEITRQVDIQLREMAVKIKDKFKDQVYAYMEQYSEQLRQQLEKLRNQSKVTQESDKSMLIKLKKLECQFDEL